MKKPIRLHLPLALATLAVLASTACQRAPALETRTFRIEHLNPWEVESLIQPYVYADREGTPGRASTGEQAITVRETADNLEKIARVLAEYDVPRPDVRLHFQLIEADGFTTSDPRIAAVEAELRKIFQFGGYRLAAEAMVSASNESSVSQQMAGAGDMFIVEGEVNWVRGNVIRLQNISLAQRDRGEILRTSVNVRPGQTLVLGSSPKEGSTATLLLTVRAESSEDL
jgi:hypothetical protein